MCRAGSWWPKVPPPIFATAMRTHHNSYTLSSALHICLPSRNVQLHRCMWRASNPHSNQRSANFCFAKVCLVARSASTIIEGDSYDCVTTRSITPEVAGTTFASTHAHPWDMLSSSSGKHWWSCTSPRWVHLLSHLFFRCVHNMHMSGLWQLARVRRLHTDGLMQSIAALGVGGSMGRGAPKLGGSNNTCSYFLIQYSPGFLICSHSW